MRTFTSGAANGASIIFCFTTEEKYLRKKRKKAKRLAQVLTSREGKAEVPASPTPVSLPGPSGPAAVPLCLAGKPGVALPPPPLTSVAVLGAGRGRRLLGRLLRPGAPRLGRRHREVSLYDGGRRARAEGRRAPARRWSRGQESGEFASWKTSEALRHAHCW